MVGRGWWVLVWTVYAAWMVCVVCGGLLSSCQHGHEYYSSQVGGCVPCTRCHEPMVVVVPCYVYQDAVCAPAAQFVPTWTLLPHAPIPITPATTTTTTSLGCNTTSRQTAAVHHNNKHSTSRKSSQHHRKGSSEARERASSRRDSAEIHFTHGKKKHSSILHHHTGRRKKEKMHHRHRHRGRGPEDPVVVVVSQQESGVVGGAVLSQDQGGNRSVTMGESGTVDTSATMDKSGTDMGDSGAMNRNVTVVDNRGILDGNGTVNKDASVLGSEGTVGNKSASASREVATDHGGATSDKSEGGVVEREGLGLVGVVGAVAGVVVVLLVLTALTLAHSRSLRVRRHLKRTCEGGKGEGKGEGKVLEQLLSGGAPHVAATPQRVTYVRPTAPPAPQVPPAPLAPLAPSSSASTVGVVEGERVYPPNPFTMDRLLEQRRVLGPASSVDTNLYIESWQQQEGQPGPPVLLSAGQRTFLRGTVSACPSPRVPRSLYPSPASASASPVASVRGLSPACTRGGTAAATCAIVGQTKPGGGAFLLTHT